MNGRAAEPPRILPLELRAAGIRRGGKRILKDLDCRIGPAPAKTFVIGPNGAGKTMFLKLCHGLVAPDQGEVVWGGVDAANETAVKWSQAMVFQRPVLLRRDAAANIDHALKLRGVAGSERADRVAALLDRTGLRRLARTPARALSFGEQQRLALARALALSPEVLFLDEPTASLDPAATHLVEEILDGVAAEGTRIVMSSHDLNQARRLADEVIFLHRGRIKEHRPAPAFFAAPENDLARDFLEGRLLWWRRRSIYGDQDTTMDTEGNRRCE
jgi:tungstate transport system ATP-binding protein